MMGDLDDITQPDVDRVRELAELRAEVARLRTEVSVRDDDAVRLRALCITLNGHVSQRDGEIARLRGLLRACVEGWDWSMPDGLRLRQAIKSARKEVEHG